MIFDQFEMNGDRWNVSFVNGRSPKLVDRTNVLTVATTDPKTMTVYLSDRLRGDFLMTVFIHELGHCALYSFGFMEKIRKMVRPEYWVEMEEFICNFLADFGLGIFRIAYSTMGYEAWRVIPQELKKMIFQKGA